MARSSESHHVFIVNEPGRDVVVTPDYLPIGRGDEVIFQVVGEKGAFEIRPETDVFDSVAEGTQIVAERGISPVRRVRRDVSIGTVHRYDVSPPKGENYDPVFIIYR